MNYETLLDWQEGAACLLAYQRGEDSEDGQMGAMMQMALLASLLGDGKG